MLTLLAALFAPPDRLPDTPPSDVVILRFPYAVAKNHSLGPTAPTELVDLDSCWFGKTRYHSDWVYYDGKGRGTKALDAYQTAVAGTWLIIRDRQGKYTAFDMADDGGHFTYPNPNLVEVNAKLAEASVGPVSDADFRTFEEWRDERDRRRATMTCSGLAGIAVGWALVVGAALVMWRRR